MKLAELKKLVSLAKRSGVKRLILNGVDLEFHRPPQTLPAPLVSSSAPSIQPLLTFTTTSEDRKAVKEALTELPPEDDAMPSDGEMLFYATPFFGMKPEKSQEEIQDETEKTETKESEAS